jgi:hypothetical protein
MPCWTRGLCKHLGTAALGCPAGQRPAWFIMRGGAIHPAGFWKYEKGEIIERYKTAEEAEIPDGWGYWGFLGAVILSEVAASRSEAATESKDRIPAGLRGEPWQGVLTGAFAEERIPCSGGQKFKQAWGPSTTFSFALRTKSFAQDDIGVEGDGSEEGLDLHRLQPLRYCLYGHVQ